VCLTDVIFSDSVPPFHSSDCGSHHERRAVQVQEMSAKDEKQQDRMTRNNQTIHTHVQSDFEHIPSANVGLNQHPMIP